MQTLFIARSLAGSYKHGADRPSSLRCRSHSKSCVQGHTERVSTLCRCLIVPAEATCGLQMLSHSLLTSVPAVSALCQMRFFNKLLAEESRQTVTSLCRLPTTCLHGQICAVSPSHNRSYALAFVFMVTRVLYEKRCVECFSYSCRVNRCHTIVHKCGGRILWGRC